MRLRSMLALLATVAVLGCDDDDPNEPTSIVGNYALQTVSGNTLPATVTVTGGSIRVVSGTLAITDNDSFTASANMTVTPTGGTATDASFACSGSYTRTGNTLVLTETDDGEDCGDEYTATVSGNTITVALPFGISGVFRK